MNMTSQNLIKYSARLSELKEQPHQVVLDEAQLDASLKECSFNL